MSSVRTTDFQIGALMVNGMDQELATVGAAFKPEVDMSRIPPRADVALDDFFQLIPKLRPVIFRSYRGHSAIRALWAAGQAIVLGTRSNERREIFNNDAQMIAAMDNKLGQPAGRGQAAVGFLQGAPIDQDGGLVLTSNHFREIECAIVVGTTHGVFHPVAVNPRAVMRDLLLSQSVLVLQVAPPVGAPANNYPPAGGNASALAVAQRAVGAVALSSVYTT